MPARYLGGVEAVVGKNRAQKNAEVDCDRGESQPTFSGAEPGEPTAPSGSGWGRTGPSTRSRSDDASERKLISDVRRTALVGNTADCNDCNRDRWPGGCLSALPPSDMDAAYPAPATCATRVRNVLPEQLTPRNRRMSRANAWVIPPSGRRYVRPAGSRGRHGLSTRVGACISVTLEPLRTGREKAVSGHGCDAVQARQG